jgi:beta-glucosidase
MEGAYDYDAVISVQWSFGYGLSYTTFAYSNLTCSKNEFTADDALTFTVDVTNTGSVAGKEAVMLYSRDMVASVVPENRRLRAFQKVDLEPGETKTVSFTISGSDFAFVGADGNWTLEKGDFRVQIGDKTAMLTCTDTRHLGRNK